MKTAAAYARYSTDKQTDNSIAYQIDAIRKYCKEHDITIIATYTDEAETGTSADRPGLSGVALRCPPARIRYCCDIRYHPQQP